jgi:hypothetical protein
LNDAPRCIAARPNLAAVRVPDAHPKVGRVARLQNDQLVAADAGAPVGDGAGEGRRDVERLFARIDNHEIVAETVHFVEGPPHWAAT